MLNILYVMLYFYSFHDATVFLRDFPLQKQNILLVVTIIPLKGKPRVFEKQFFLQKAIYFKKKDYFCKQQKKEVINCIIFCKSI